MIFFYLLIIPLVSILIKLILYQITKKYGKFSYDGFSTAGFAYNSKKDIFYSTKNAWQKNFGYTHMYDVLAPIFNMIIDTESIRFNYNNKNWLIAFWKGQYGIVTGAEIGIYYTNQKKVNKKTVYMPVSDSEMLDMYLILYKNKKIITKVKTKHWWLAIFKLGMFSNPKELSMNINITFPDKQMLNAFLESFKKIGYKNQDFKIIDNTFCFNYTTPRTHKVWTRSWLTDKIRQHINRKNTETYDEYIQDLIDDNQIDDSKIKKDKVIILNDLLPDILKNAQKNEINSKEIITKIINEDETNIIFIDSDNNPETGENKND